jgi:hypothetical protein
VWKVADAQAQQTLEAFQAEVTRLQGLVERYENLEKAGLDGILQTGMAAVALPLEGVELGAKGLKKGLELIEQALRSLQGVLPTGQDAVLWLEGRVSALANGIQRLEAGLARALDKATDNRVADSLKDLINLVLDKLPFGLGDKIRAALDGVVNLVSSLDELLEGVNTRVLDPLRTTWFSTVEGQGVGETFFMPLVEHVLDPLEAHLEELATLTGTWQQKLAAPAQQALDERAKVREDIARYKREQGLR